MVSTCILYTDVSTLKQLTSLVYGKKQNTLNIIQRTSTHYINLAMFLLNDENCDIVDSLEIQYQHDPERIVREVFKKWISGTGKKPVTWQTLFVQECCANSRCI